MGTSNIRFRIGPTIRWRGREWLNWGRFDPFTCAAFEWPESAHPRHCRTPRRRSVDRVDSSRSPFWQREPLAFAGRHHRVLLSPRPTPWPAASGQAGWRRGQRRRPGFRPGSRSPWRDAGCVRTRLMWPWVNRASVRIIRSRPSAVRRRTVFSDTFKIFAVYTMV